MAPFLIYLGTLGEGDLRAPQRPAGMVFGVGEVHKCRGPQGFFLVSHRPSPIMNGSRAQAVIAKASTGGNGSYSIGTEICAYKGQTQLPSQKISNVLL